MPSGTFAVVRYVPDPVRDEPINVGVITSGPAGALFKTDPKGWARIRTMDAFVDPETIGYAQEYLTTLVAKPVVELTAQGIHEVQPWEDGFCDALRGQLPERFRLGQSLYVDYADERLETMEAAASDLVSRLVTPPPRRMMFPDKDPGAPFERIKKRLQRHIDRKLVHVHAAIQGWSQRVREPDFFYRRQDGTPVVVNVVRMDYRQPAVLSRTADANAFILLDLERARDAYVVALVEWPAEPTEEFFEALKSLEAVADEILNARDAADAVAERILTEATPTPA